MCYSLALILAAVIPTIANSADSQIFALLDKMEKLVLSRGKSQDSRNSRRKNCSRSQSESKPKMISLLISSTFLRKSYQVYATLQLEANETGKLEAELFPATDSLAARHLIVRDRVTSIKFLMDTGTDVDHFCLKTRSYLHYRVLYAANETIIPTYKNYSSLIWILSCFSMPFHNQSWILSLLAQIF